MGESQQHGFCSLLVSKCNKCNDLIKFRTSQLLPVADQLHYAVNIGAVLGQIATGGGSAHLAEQMACINVPSLSQPHFLTIERALGTMFEEEVTKGVLSAGEKERQIAIPKNSYCDGVPSCTVIVGA